MSEPIFDHEKLDVYGVSIAFVAWTGSKGCRGCGHADVVGLLDEYEYEYEYE